MINLGQSLRDAGTWNILAPWIKDIACTVLPGIQCRLVQEAPHLYCLEISAYLDQDLPIGSFQVQFAPAFAPSFHWAPHLTPEPGDVIDMHVFRTPALIASCDGRALCLLPDVDHLGGAGSARTFMDMDAQADIFALGLTTTRIREHVLYQRTDEIVLPAGPFHFAVRLLLQQGSEATTNPFRAVLAYYWQRYGKNQLDLLAPLEALPTYVKRTYHWAFDAWRDRLWQEFTLDGVTVGAPQFIVTVWQSRSAPGGHDIREHVSIWNQAWFCSLRSAMGVFRYARRTGDSNLMAFAQKTKELALHFPQEDGLFDSVIAVPDVMVEENGRLLRRGGSWKDYYFGNSDRNPYGLPIASAPRHILDMSWTALHMVRWYQELEPDQRLLDYATRYARRLLTLQDAQGYFPAWLKDGQPLPILAQSPESAASATFLLELYRVTGHDAYRAAALRTVEVLVKEVLPCGRWEDFETYWSCSRWGSDTQVGRQVPRNKQFKQCTLSMFYLAEALLLAYDVTGCREWLQHGERCLDELLMAQSSFQPASMPIPVVGGFGVMNADAELNDARQSLFSEVILRYGHLLGREEYLQRGEAALRASFSMMYCPENPSALAQWQIRWPFLNKQDYGFMMENYGHDGRADELHTGIGEFTIYDWGNGAASEAVMRVMDHGTAALPHKGVFHMHKPKILVVGSFVMDLIVSTDRFPNSGETVLGRSYRTAPGGKGANQAVQAARLGADVTMVGKVGQDSFGQELLSSASASGVDVSRVIRDPEAPSAVGNVQLEVTPAGTANRIIVVSGANMTITPADVAFLEEEIGQFDLVILQLEIPMEINCLVASWAKRKGVPVMLNSAPYAPIPDALLACTSYISPNEHEAALLTRLPVDTDAHIADALHALPSLGVQHALITLGSRGVACLNDEGEVVTVPALKGLDVKDPTAAGDSFVGAFCVAVCLGVPLEQALRFANHTAAITVCRMGAQPSLPTVGEVLDLMRSRGEDTAPFQGLCD